MPALTILPLKSSLRPNRSTPFSGSGGTGPYSYEVIAGGAGGTVDADGVYTAPQTLGNNPAKTTDTIRVTDSAAPTPAIADALALIQNPLQVLAGILQEELNLTDGRVYLWNQKIFEPTDQGLFIAIKALVPKPFGVTNAIDADGNEVQSVNMCVNTTIDLISRDLSAFNRQAEVIMALSSLYSEQQQEANAMYIAKLSNNFVNLSDLDGAAIPYRFQISVNVQYSEVKTKAAPYYNSFEAPEVTVDDGTEV